MRTYEESRTETLELEVSFYNLLSEEWDFSTKEVEVEIFFETYKEDGERYFEFNSHKVSEKLTKEQEKELEQFLENFFEDFDYEDDYCEYDTTWERNADRYFD